MSAYTSTEVYIAACLSSYILSSNQSILIPAPILFKSISEKSAVFLFV